MFLDYLFDVLLDTDNTIDKVFMWIFITLYLLSLIATLSFCVGLLIHTLIFFIGLVGG